MTVNVDDYLAGYGLGGTVLQHKERTIKDVFDEMTDDEKDFQAIIVAAAIGNESLELAPEVVGQYNALSDEHKNIIDFLVGNILAEENVKHASMDVENFLSHYGVKGMKWGVIRDRVNAPGSLSRSSSNTSAGRAAARTKVKAGTASKKEEHLASLKSTGHRAINALTGDKTFWRRMAITTGLTVGVVAAPVAAAWLLPVGALSAIGSTGAASALGIGGVSSILTNAELGAWALGATGVYGSLGVATAGTAGNVVGNTARAVAGNSLINRSYARVGKNISDRQSRGRQRVMKALKTVGGVRDQDLKHGAIEHALEAGSGGKGGKRAFDESKVKRDGGGQFAKASGRRPADDIRTPAQIDASWKSDIGKNTKLMSAMWGPKSPMTSKMNSKIADIKKRTGVDLNKAKASGTKSPAVTKAANELMTYIVAEGNKRLASQPAAVSPSGTERVQLRLVNSGTDSVDFKYVFVPNRLKHTTNLEEFLAHHNSVTLFEAQKEG